MPQPQDTSILTSFKTLTLPAFFPYKFPEKWDAKTAELAGKAFREVQVAVVGFAQNFLDRVRSGIARGVRVGPIEIDHLAAFTDVPFKLDASRQVSGREAGATFRGWVVTNLTAAVGSFTEAGIIYHDPDASVDKSKFVRLKTHGFAENPVVTLWIW